MKSLFISAVEGQQLPQEKQQPPSFPKVDSYINYYELVRVQLKQLIAAKDWLAEHFQIVFPIQQQQQDIDLHIDSDDISLLDLERRIDSILAGFAKATLASRENAFFVGYFSWKNSLLFEAIIKKIYEQEKDKEVCRHIIISSISCLPFVSVFPHRNNSYMNTLGFQVRWSCG